MNHKCKNWFINDCGGEVHCDVCGNGGYFTELGITAEAVINAGGYNEPDEDGKIPEHDVQMIQDFYQSEINHLKKNLRAISRNTWRNRNE